MTYWYVLNRPTGVVNERGEREYTFLEMNLGAPPGRWGAAVFTSFVKADRFRQGEKGRRTEPEEGWLIGRLTTNELAHLLRRTLLAGQTSMAVIDPTHGSTVRALPIIGFLAALEGDDKGKLLIRALRRPRRKKG